MNDCVFCCIASGSTDPELAVYEDEHVFVQIDLQQKPRNRGHVLVIPKHHVTNLFESPSILDAPLPAAIRHASTAVKMAFSADGIQVRQNNGTASGQDVFHLFFHVIPRYDEDDSEDTDYERIPLCDRIALAEKLKPFLNK
jgi:diadenosine tetraphosphate (Ap4A) HIT family hydrolase